MTTRCAPFVLGIEEQELAALQTELGLRSRGHKYKQVQVDGETWAPPGS